MIDKHLVTTPHSSNVHEFLQHEHCHKINSKLTNVLLGPLTAQRHNRTMSNQNDIKQIARAQSAPCLGTHVQANDADAAPIVDDQQPSRTLRLLNQIVIIGLALIIYQTSVAIFRNSYVSIAMTVILALVLDGKNSLCGLLAWAYLPLTNAETPTQVLQDASRDESFHCMYCYDYCILFKYFLTY